VLSSLLRIEGNPHLIPGLKEGAPLADLKKPWAAITKAAGLDVLLPRRAAKSARRFLGKALRLRQECPPRDNQHCDARHLDGIETIYIVVEPDHGGDAVRRWLSPLSGIDRSWSACQQKTHRPCTWKARTSS
jgi:hypothetical protein